MPFSSNAERFLSLVLYSMARGFGQASALRVEDDERACLKSFASASAACEQLLRVLQNTTTLRRATVSEQVRETQEYVAIIHDARLAR